MRLILHNKILTQPDGCLLASIICAPYQARKVLEEVENGALKAYKRYFLSHKLLFNGNLSRLGFCIPAILRYPIELAHNRASAAIFGGYRLKKISESKRENHQRIRERRGKRKSQAQRGANFKASVRARREARAEATKARNKARKPLESPWKGGGRKRKAAPLLTADR